MRQFDYTTVPAELEATPITNLLLSIREHKGRQLALSQVKPELLSSLMEEAKIQSTRSSNGLEGIVTTQKRLKAIMAYSAKPSSRAEEEIAGYRDVLSLIHEQHDSIPVTPSVILQLHRDLMAHTAISYGGHWKDSDNEIVSIDDQGNRFVRFRPPSALATPGLIKEACQSLNDALSRQVCDPPPYIAPLYLRFCQYSSLQRWQWQDEPAPYNAAARKDWIRRCALHQHRTTY